MQTCTQLVLDSSDPELSFDSEGICSKYHDFQQNVRPMWEASLGGDGLNKTLAAIKLAGQNREYDCILGLSGGADSSYMLHMAVKEFGLRPLVFHVDAGWNTELAVHNIHCMIDKLQLDLFTEVINWEEVKEFQLCMFKSGLPYIDLPQDIAFIGVLYQYAAKYGIKYILNGGNISTECVSYPLQYYYFGDMVMVKDVFRQHATRQIVDYPFTSIAYRKLYMPYVRGVRVVKPLNSVSYIKRDAMALLAEEYGWKPYAQKHFESRFTRFFEGYWLPTRFGYDVRRVQYSSMILTGQMTRDEAMHALEKPPYDEDLIKQDFSYIATKLGVSIDTLKQYQTIPKKYYWNYKNSNRFLSLGESILSKISKTKRGGAY